MNVPMREEAVFNDGRKFILRPPGRRFRTPQVVARRTVADLRAGRDAVLEAAHAELRKGAGKP